MQVNKKSVVILNGIVLSTMAFSYAKADVTTTVTSTSVEPSTSTIKATPDSVVYFRMAPQTALITTIEGRRKDIEKAIDQAHEHGQITSEQCDSIKRELRRVGEATGTNTISYPAAVMLAQDLDFIGSRYITVNSTTPPYVPIITGSSFTVSTGQTFQLDDLSARRANLETRITKDLLEGRLTPMRATELRSQLSTIGTEANLYSANGNFDAKESRRLYNQFDHVASEIEKYAGKDKDS